MPEGKLESIGGAPVITIDCTKVGAWQSFDELFAAALGFPAWYEGSPHDWSRFMLELDNPQFNECGVLVPRGQVLTIRIGNGPALYKSAKRVFDELARRVAFVNFGRLSREQGPILTLSFSREHTE